MFKKYKLLFLFVLAVFFFILCFLTFKSIRSANKSKISNLKCQGTLPLATAIIDNLVSEKNVYDIKNSNSEGKILWREDSKNRPFISLNTDDALSIKIYENENEKQKVLNYHKKLDSIINNTDEFIKETEKDPYMMIDQVTLQRKMRDTFLNKIKIIESYGFQFDDNASFYADVNNYRDIYSFTKEGKEFYNVIFTYYYPVNYIDVNCLIINPNIKSKLDFYNSFFSTVIGINLQGESTIFSEWNNYNNNEVLLFNSSDFHGAGGVALWFAKNGDGWEFIEQNQIDRANCENFEVKKVGKGTPCYRYSNESTIEDVVKY